MDSKKIRYRLRQDRRLAVIVSLATVAVIGFIPFAIYRLIQGELLVAALDITIIASIIITTAYICYTGDTNRPSQIFMYFLGVMGIIGIRLLGQGALPWIYTMLVANFFLVDRRYAMGVAIFFMGVILIDGNAFPTLLARFTFITTALSICFYSYIFAYQTEMQRQQLENLAARDPLTGAFNRRTLQQEMERASQNFKRELTVYGLLVIDIDYFKKVNDTWGHDAGDEVLVSLARLIENSIRRTDRFFRFGGEEFVVLVCPTKPESLTVMAKHLCLQVETQLSYRGNSITVSIGGAVLQADESPDEWFARADAALFCAKKEGRNQVIMDL